MALKKGDSEYFTRKLSELMARNGTTQVDLAKKLGIKQPSVSQFLNGKAYPSTLTLIRMARIFRATLYEMTNLDSLKDVEVGGGKSPELTPEQKRVLNAYIKLDDDDWRKKAIQTILSGSK